MNKNDYKTIDEYLDLFESDIRMNLEEIRGIIHKLAPKAVETISYQMPTFKLNGKVLVHFAGYKSHIGFYPTPSPIAAFKDSLKNYKTSKGTVQFTLKEKLPLTLISDMVRFRIDEVTENC